MHEVKTRMKRENERLSCSGNHETSEQMDTSKETKKMGKANRQNERRRGETRREISHVNVISRLFC